VYRVVRESDAANHAGKAVWAWDDAVCLNLNHAFLGVAFEARSAERANPAQIHSGRILTEMLVNKYGIRPANCLAHGQVSVNPVNMRIGWHTDWARNFPYAELGLPNNYEQRIAAVTEFGFRADDIYFEAAGESLWIGIHRSELQLRERAEQEGLTVRELRRRLERRYRDLERKAGLYAD
jgi:hypothetical protein